MKFKDERTDRPWGCFRLLVDNAGPCTVKMMYVNKGESLSLQYHYKRSQMYYIIDDGFVITLADEPGVTAKREVYPALPGAIYIAKERCIHSAKYTGPKKYGRFVDIALGVNDENDIVRISDLYGRDMDNWFRDEESLYAGDVYGW